MSDRVEDSAEPGRARQAAPPARWPASLASAALVLLALCLVAWTVARIGSGLGRPEGAAFTLAAIEWFGWAAVSLGALYLAALLVRALQTIRRGAALRSVLPWIAVLVLGGLAFWSFDGIRIAAIGIHAALMDLALTRDQAFQLSARLYPLIPYIGLQVALMPEPVWAFWHAGRMVAGTALWALFLAFTATGAFAVARWRGRDVLSWLLILPSAAGLGYLIVQAADRSAAYTFVAPWLSMNPGPARAEILVSNFLAVTAATLSVLAGLQVYRLIRRASLANIKGGGLAPPRALTLFVIACLLLPFADLYGQFNLVLKNREIAKRVELHKDAKKLRIRGSSREVRSRPDRNASALGTLPAGATVSILETRGGWGRIADGQWVRLSDRGSTATASPRSASGSSKASARSGQATRKRDLVENLTSSSVRPSGGASPGQASRRTKNSQAPGADPGGKSATAKTHRCLGATVEHRPHSLRLAARGEWTEYEKRHERISVLKCVRYRGEAFVIVGVAGARDRQAGIEAYSLETLDKRFGYFCDREDCHDSALPFPDDFPLEKK